MNSIYLQFYSWSRQWRQKNRNSRMRWDRITLHRKIKSNKKCKVKEENRNYPWDSTSATAGRMKKRSIHNKVLVYYSGHCLDKTCNVTSLINNSRKSKNFPLARLFILYYNAIVDFTAVAGAAGALWGSDSFTQTAGATGTYVPCIYRGRTQEGNWITQSNYSNVKITK